MTVTDGRLVRGARSRGVALAIAVNVASVEGLDGLSIGGLAAASGLSKSGIVALFGTKVELQLATIAAAREIFISEVVDPTLSVEGGVARLETLVSTWLTYSRTRVFAGGCFFAAGIAEVGSKPGPVRDAIAVAVEDWYAFVARSVSRAQVKGELRPSIDPDELAFALGSFLESANARSLITGRSEPYELAAASARSLLAVSRV
ncbi:MAG TPA: TetR family transcriptional regulator C-terminal domain-containing protein [Galbitalea sp.]